MLRLGSTDSHGRHHGTGRSKIYFEYDGTAHWNGRVQASTVSPIPVDCLSVLAFGTPTLDR